jgi:putative flippase GtrA
MNMTSPDEITLPATRFGTTPANFVTDYLEGHGRSDFVPQLSRYSIASAVALGVDFGVYIALCALTVKAPLAGIVGYAAGMLVHYILSSNLVFDVAQSPKSASRRLTEFVFSGVFGLILTGSTIAVLTELFSIAPLAAKVFAVLVSFTAVFLIRRWFVFAPQTDEQKDAERARVYSKSASCDLVSDLSRRRQIDLQPAE